MKTLKTFILASETLRGPHFQHERDDCSVRAIMVLLEVPYATAHTIMHLNGRNDALRWSGAFIKAIEKAGGRSIVRYKSTKTGDFVARHPEGRFLVWVHGHVFAVVDGVCFDTAEMGTKRTILYAWQFPSEVI